MAKRGRPIRNPLPVKREHPVRNPLPPLAREPALRLTPGQPCPRCHGMVIVRDVVTPEGCLHEHFCLGCARTSNPVLDADLPASRIRLTVECEAQLDRVVLALARAEPCRSGPSGDSGVDGMSGIVVSRNTLDAVDAAQAFRVECLPDEPLA